MHEPMRPRLPQAEHTGRPPSHRILLFRQFLQATWIFRRFGLGEYSEDCGIGSLLDADPTAEGDWNSIYENQGYGTSIISSMGWQPIWLFKQQGVRDLPHKADPDCRVLGNFFPEFGGFM